ncbi:hypothetical protein [Pseudobacillus badius]|uniref:hypothetical protein n=1 Tax=Bacillus badius TaxID=1455 RepID=UPI0007B05A96|nr:hypothetical protein [Bacillus badius]KZN99116.1 hypothetical protein A4244_08480 [Bacillus badius]OCS84054.1 hypothetical protein A6M11_08495 [Bacillus badius]OVE52652.1 hypothetical protein B1A98_03335 [Bacillus badius]TDW04660.1 hypothetical protein B0G66_10285 [Bacillus badius]
MKMSITRGLAELKLLDKRIQSTMKSTPFISYAVGDKPVSGFAATKEFEEKAKSTYQSTLDLIKRRNAIKSAIVLSNAMTHVEVAGEKYTVAEAIERKTSIQYEQRLLEKMKQEFAAATREVEQINDDVKQQLDHQLEVLYGREAKLKVEESNELTKSYREKHEAKVIDPLKLRDKYEKLEKQIDEFLAEVDFVLSTSNTLTEIEVPE